MLKRLALDRIEEKRKRKENEKLCKQTNNDQMVGRNFNKNLSIDKLFFIK